jgi:hypothetical protein
MRQRNLKLLILDISEMLEVVKIVRESTHFKCLSNKHLSNVIYSDRPCISRIYNTYMTL